MSELKVNDVINARLEIELLDAPEDITEIDILDYATKYKYSYSCGKVFVSGDVKFEAGFMPDSDIEDWIEDDIKSFFEEIEDYEIFDVDKDDLFHQSAKIRVKSVKE